MRSRWSVLSLFVAASLCACSSKDNGKPDSGRVGDGTGDVSDGKISEQGVDRPVGTGEVGAPCQSDGGCKSGMCFAQKCARACSEASDCDTSQDCGSDDGKRVFCYDRTYTGKGIGTSCAITNTCPGSKMYCVGPGGGSSENGAAYCTAECQGDTDCPPDYTCFAMSNAQICIQRSFCTRCVVDEQCRDGGKCVQQGKEKFCTLPCHQGSTECPRFAKCADVGGGSYQCEHKAGTCAGDGSLCQPCQVGQDCSPGSVCLILQSKETFCGSNCASASCPGGYVCQSVGTYKQCKPDNGNPPFCVPLSPTMEVGDIMDDFPMVGYKDTNKDNSLVGETLKVIRFSDYANDPSVKAILFSVSAGWCGPCQEETKLFAGLMTTYGPKGLMIVQTLFDTDTEGEPATKAFLSTWVKTFKPAGACGIDPAGNSIPFNTAGTTPLNFILDAKTRKILSKFNTAVFLDSEIKKALGI
jgi:thiol-disulfide isomerase/thioredoxin